MKFMRFVQDLCGRSLTVTGCPFPARFDLTETY